MTNTDLLIDHGKRCPRCNCNQKWDRIKGLCYDCNYGLPKKRMPISETTKSTLRTVFAVLPFVVQLIALHFIWHYHPR